MFQPENPYHRDEILAATAFTRDDIARFYSELPLEIFYARPKQGWSPWRNLRHLVKTGIALNLGLLQPRFMLRLFFGRDAKGRPLEETGADYLNMLAGGRKAGIYAPVNWARTPRDMAQTHEGIIEAWKRTITAGMGIVEKKWPDADLDRYRLPHPLLGKIPVREMLQFSLLHAYHHTEIVRKRVKR